MSTAVLYHLFRIRGYHVIDMTSHMGLTTITIAPRRKALCCSACGSYQVSRAGTVNRFLRSVPCGSQAVTLKVLIPRLLCTRCGVTRQHKLTFAAPRVRYTRSFARYVLALARQMSLYALARHLHVGWDLIKSIVKNHLKRRYAHPPLKGLKRIAIDEIHLGRRIGYCTVVMDLDSGAVVFIGQGANTAALRPFWRRLKASGAQIQAVATDMALSYWHAVKTYFPNAVHVLDRFHVVKLFKEALDALRRRMVRWNQGEQGKVIRGIRWLLLKSPENLNPDRGEANRLQKALQLNKPLMTAYYLGEKLDLLWQQDSKESAAKFLGEWLADTAQAGTWEMTRFAKTIRRHQDRILAWYDHQISTGPLESVNARIRLVQRKAFGYRDMEFFKLLVYSMHEHTYA